MKLRVKVGLATLVLSSLVSGGCSRAPIEAVNLANEADKQRQVDLEGAIAKYEQAIQLDPSNHRIIWKLALAYRKKEAWDKVASTLARAVQVAPTYANYWFHRGFALARQAEAGALSWEEAKEPLRKCIELDPGYSDCYHELGLVHLYTDNEQEALVNYTKAIEHEPTRTEFYWPLAELYLNLDYVEEARAVLQEGLTFAEEDDPNAYDMHILMSEVYARKNQPNERVSHLERAKALNDREAEKSGGLGPHPEILFNLGSTYAVLDPPRKTEALQLLNRFVGVVCKGSAGATKYRSVCAEAQAHIGRLGGGI